MLMGDENQHLDILHDHYKDSFSLIREREKTRDKAFFWIVLLLGLLFLEVQYPTVIKAMFTEVSGSGFKFNPAKVPIGILASITWVLMFIMTLRYFQFCITVDRQYNYLHLLEDKISDSINEEDVYRREGKAYKSEYPAFTWWARIFYTLLFPVVSMLVMFIIVKSEHKQGILIFNFYFDVILALGITISIILYRGLGFYNKWNKKRQKVKDQKAKASIVVD